MKHLLQTDRYVMHQLHALNNLVQQAFQSFNFQSCQYCFAL